MINRRDNKMKKNNRLMSELKDVQMNPIPNFDVGLKDDNINEWRATIIGPSDSPYEGGVFELDISFPVNYPFTPPKVSFVTRIFHPNINSDGDICLDILKDKWSPALKIPQVLLSISSLMVQPNPEDPLEPDVAKLYKDNKVMYDKKAKEYTVKYANGKTDN